MASTSDPVWDIRFSGTARIAEKPLRVAVFLHEGKTAVVAVEVIGEEIKVSALFKQFFAGLHWPTEIFNLSLTDSSIFYNYVSGTEFDKLANLPPAIQAQQGNVPGEGLFVATTISLALLGHDFPTVLAQVNTVEGKGFIIKGDLKEPVSLFSNAFLQIYGPRFSGGPQLEVQSFDQPRGASRHFGLNCAYQLFGHRFGESFLTVSKDGGQPKLTAHLKSDVGLGPFLNPLEVDFSWSSKDGFQVQNFPRIPIPIPILQGSIS